MTTSTALPTVLSATTRGRSRISFDVLAVELDDDVARQDGAVVDRPALDDAGDQRALGRCHAEALGDVVGHRLDAHAEPAAPRLAELAELVDDAQRQLDGNRKADADRAAGRRDDRRVDADHLAVHVEQRPPELPRLIAASVWMKSSYGPELMSRLRAETMPTVTEPPSPNGLPIAITQSPTRILSGIAEFHRRQFVPLRIDLQHRDVGLGVGADQLRLQLRRRRRN